MQGILVPKTWFPTKAAKCYTSLAHFCLFIRFTFFNVDTFSSNTLVFKIDTYLKGDTWKLLFHKFVKGTIDRHSFVIITSVENWTENNNYKKENILSITQNRFT